MPQPKTGIYVIGEVRGCSSSKNDKNELSRHVHLEVVGWNGQPKLHKIKDKFPDEVRWQDMTGKVICLCVEQGVFQGNPYMSSNTFGPQHMLGVGGGAIEKDAATSGVKSGGGRLG